MQKILQYGIIGCGMMGQEHIRNIKLLPNTKIGMIYEPNAEMRAEAIKLAPDVIVADSMEAMVSNQDIDCVVIASPNHLHCSQLEAIAKIRQIPILVEKPLFTNPADISRITQFIEQYQAPVWVAMEYRYMPPVAKFIEDVNAATGGIKMLTIREHRFPFLPKVNDWNRFNKNTGGTLVEKCCHFFDLMRIIIGSEPVRVMASADQSVNHLDENYGDNTPDIWDNGFIIVDFANSCRAMLELCMFAEGSKFQEEISALGADGKIEVKVPGPTRFWPEHMGEPPVPELVVSPRNPVGPKTVQIPVDPELLEAGDHNGSTFYQHEKFASVIRGEKQEIEVGLIDGLRAVQMGLAAQQSAISGQSIEIKTDTNQSSVAC